MKILLTNKFYYNRGGDFSYMHAVEQLLIQQGHDVAVFSMQYPLNFSSPWQSYFPSEISFSLKNNKRPLESLFRTFGTKEVKEKFSRLLDDFKPDVVHLNNVHSYLSPVMAQLASERGVKVVWTLHDYKLLCPRYDCRRNGVDCDLCFYDKRNVVKYNCMKNSRIASIIAYYEAKKWNREKLQKYTDTFICPSEFMKMKMLQGGFSPDKLVTLNNFIDVKKTDNTDFVKGDYYAYVGRISTEKGIATLVKVASGLPYQLKIAGMGPLYESLKNKYTQKNIEFLGLVNWDDIKMLLSKARFSVMPSECNENNPISVIESHCLGTPVLGAKIGGIPESIEEGKNGLFFESGNEKDLSEKIKSLYEKSYLEMNCKDIAETARKKYSESEYYDKLLAIYRK